MSGNRITVESLLADSMPTSNYRWADEFPNLSLNLPNINFGEDKSVITKRMFYLS